MICLLQKLKHQDSSEESLPYGKKVVVSKSGVSKEPTRHSIVYVCLLYQKLYAEHISVSFPLLWSLGRLWKKGKAEYRDWKPNVPESGQMHPAICGQVIKKDMHRVSVPK
jgi:hypothetical protein